jgi:glutathionyl-hydroquinone reductase
MQILTNATPEEVNNIIKHVKTNYNFDINAKDQNCNPGLVLACESFSGRNNIDMDMVNCYLKNGADPRATNDEAMDAIGLATKYASRDPKYQGVVDLLKKYDTHRNTIVTIPNSKSSNSKWVRNENGGYTKT